MDENIFTTDVEAKPKKSFSGGFKFLLGLGIFLTGLMNLVGIQFIVLGVIEQVWREMGMFEYVRQGILYLCLMCCFAFMVKIAVNERPFSNLLVRCVRIIGCLITISAFLLPRLSGYEDSGFVIMQFGSFTLIDGNMLMFGTLLLIFAGIIKEGFSMQNELDEVL
ncbi:MAG: DUF2975 domain-containing protein [Hespellia sp.]|nr:DUF2975 domain-containing protein [Hespellia sp.]